MKNSLISTNYISSELRSPRNRNSHDSVPSKEDTEKISTPSPSNSRNKDVVPNNTNTNTNTNNDNNNDNDNNNTDKPKLAAITPTFSQESISVDSLQQTLADQQKQLNKLESMLEALLNK